MMKNLKLYEDFNSRTGEYTSAEMDAFMRELIDTIIWSDKSVPNWKRVTITVPGSDYGTGSPISTNREDAIQHWDGAMERYSKESNARWYVWDAVVGGSLNKPKKISAQRFDIQSILDIIRKYPDALHKMKIGLDSDNADKFAEFMRKEHYTGKSGNHTGD